SARTPRGAGAAGAAGAAPERRAGLRAGRLRSSEPDPEPPDEAAASASPSASADPSAGAGGTSGDTAQDRFAALLAEHREVDFDPGEEPSAEEAYAAAMAEHAADLSDCGLTPNTVAEDCERPDSLGEDLEETIN